MYSRMMEKDATITDFIKSCYPLGIPGEMLFYGGSFNPWHDGHREVIKRVQGRDVIVIPDRNPLKPLNPFSLEQSLEAIRRDLVPRQWLYTGFLERNAHNPTQLWIRQVRSHFPQMDLGLLMGFDNFAILNKWFKIEELLGDLSNLCILSRQDDEVLKESQKKWVKTINPKLQLVFLGPHEFETISSSQLRDGANHKYLTEAI